MTMVSFQLEDNYVKDLDEVTDNRSEFIRTTIISKIQSVKEKSLNDLIIDAEELNNRLDLVNNLINDKFNILREKQQLESKEIEDKLIQKELKQKELLDKYSNLEQFDFIKNFEYVNNWNNMANLLPIVDKLLDNNIKIGIVQLREYLTLRKH